MKDEPIGDYLQTEKFAYLKQRYFPKTSWKNENYLLYKLSFFWIVSNACTWL